MSKVISIGNLSMGGTGKTPFAIKIAQKYLSDNYKICVLSRGYKGKIGYGVNIISDGSHIYNHPPLAADEPYMIAQNLPNAIVITGKKRTDSFSLAEKLFKPDIFILDDGFQHKKLKRDIDIVLLDYNNPISTGLPFPFGYLREFPSALGRADIIIFTRCSQNSLEIPHKVRKYISGKPIFYSFVKSKDFYINNSIIELDNYGQQFFCFSGIANNKQFFNLLENKGINLVGTKSFNDHYCYQENDIIEINKLANTYKADLILTTEKDYVKIPANLRNNIAYLKISVDINKEESFFNVLNEKLGISSKKL